MQLSGCFGKCYQKNRLHRGRSIINLINEPLYSLASITYSHSVVNISNGPVSFLRTGTHAGSSHLVPLKMSVQF